MHVRQSIREKAVSLLLGLPLTGGNVYSTRVRSFDEDDLPKLVVYTKDEEITRGSQDRPARQERLIELIVEGYFDAKNDLDDLMDEAAKDIEAVICANPTFDLVAKDSALTAIETQFENRSKPLGLLRMTFVAEYHTREGFPETTI